MAATVVQLSGDSSHADEPLEAKVIHDAPQISRTMRRVRLDCSHCLRVVDLLRPERARTYTLRVLAGSKSGLTSGGRGLAVTPGSPWPPRGVAARGQNAPVDSLESLRGYWG